MPTEPISTSVGDEPGLKRPADVIAPRGLVGRVFGLAGPAKGDSASPTG